jgi:hypothetical protein
VKPAAGEFYPHIVWTAAQTATRVEVATLADLPAVGAVNTNYLVRDVREWWVYSSDTWGPVAREVDDMLERALAIVAHQALVLHTEAQMAALRDLMKMSTVKNHLTEFASFLAQEKTYVQAQTEALRSLREMRLALATPDLVSDTEADGPDYFFTTNTFVL